jgi:hypothetical protein
MDYSPEVAGNSTAAHNVSDPITAGGLVFYARRAVHLRDGAGIADRTFAPITIRTTAIVVS